MSRIFGPQLGAENGGDQAPRTGAEETRRDLPVRYDQHVMMVGVLCLDGRQPLQHIRPIVARPLPAGTLLLGISLCPILDYTLYSRDSENRSNTEN